MIRAYVHRLVESNRDFLLSEMFAVKGLVHLIMKHRNTGEKWTVEEKKEIVIHLKNISKAVPALIIFALPFGSLLLPFLAEALDRRHHDRPS